MAIKAPAIGIDLGITNSVVAVYQNGKVEIIANDLGNYQTPSWVAFTDTGSLVGEAARNQAAMNPENTVYDVKRLIGRKFEDDYVQANIQHWPFEVVNDNSIPKIKVTHKGSKKIFWPEEISAMVITNMKATAEAYLGMAVKDAVITVPAYFNDSQRLATNDAGIIAGLNVLRIINEPTAVAIAYELGKKVRKRNVLIYDIGSRSFDVTILTIDAGIFKVLSTGGDTHLGGGDFDSQMVHHCVEDFKRKYKKNLTTNKRSMLKLRWECERAKKVLSKYEQTTIQIESLYEGIDYNKNITRAQFELLNAELFQATLEPITQCINDANMDKGEIDEVMIVGGSTRIPMIRKLLMNFFNGIELNKSIKPDQAIAYGAAVLASVLTGDKSAPIYDATPLSLGIQAGDIMSSFIKRNTPIPAQGCSFISNKMSTKAPAIGIDLGTTNSCVAVCWNGKVKIIANDLGSFTTPSCVAFTETGSLVGEAAMDQIAINHKNTIYDLKRLIGRKWDYGVQADMQHWPFEVVNDKSKPVIKITHQGSEKIFCPEEISAMILTKMKETAEAYLGMEVKDAVITVPAHFNDSQRLATIDAGNIAGLNILGIINEPTAAAIAYGLGKEKVGKRNILVYDLGSGYFDVAILSIDSGMFKVLSTSGDTHLAGEDFNSQLVNYCVEDFKKEHNKDFKTNKKALRRLRTACERAKIILSSITETSIEIDSLYDGIDYQTSITRAKLEELNADLFQSTLQHVTQCLHDVKMDKSEVDEVVIVGGSTRIPKIQYLLRDFFNDKKLNESINSDEAVAYGAAVRAAILAGDNSVKIILRDVTTHSLEVFINKDNLSTIIKRNTPIPARATRENFITLSENQTATRVVVYEGERVQQLSYISNIPPNLYGEFKICVTFIVDTNGILEIAPAMANTIHPKTIKEESPRVGNFFNFKGMLRKKEVAIAINETPQSIRLSFKNERGRLSENQIKSMISKAEKRLREDEIIRIAITKKKLQDYCYKIKDILLIKELGLLKSDHAMILDKCNETIDWVDSDQMFKNEEYERKHEDIEADYKRSISNNTVKIGGAFFRSQ